MVPPEVAERTRHFYAWERRGRGWWTWAYPVVLEPPFLPYYWHAPQQGRRGDDGRLETWRSRLARSLQGGGSAPPLPEALLVESEPEPEPFADEDKLREFVALLPEGERVSLADAAGWLQSLSTCAAVSFELVGESGRVHVRLACREGDAVRVAGSVETFFPAAVVLPADRGLDDLWIAAGGAFSILEFGLAREFMVPLTTARGLDPDPLQALIGALASARRGELAVVQVLFEEVTKPWADSILRSVISPTGDPFFADAPEFTKLAEEKVSSPLYAVVLRLSTRASTTDAAWELMRGAIGGLRQFGNRRNELVPLGGEDLDVLELDLLLRETHRSGIVLSLDELVSLVHLPGASVRTAALVRELGKTKAPPEEATGEGVLLGENVHRGTLTDVRLSPSARSRHMHVVGASGTGKSTLLVNLILQDIADGEGVGVVDPHGDLVDEVLGRIPDHRQNDVILLDPADPEYVVGWNILEARSPVEKEVLASDLVSVFRRLSTSWGDQMTTVLSNALLAFLESRAGGTLLDLREFLVDPAFRKRFLAGVGDPFVVGFWEREFPLLGHGKSIAPILTRLNTFLRSRLIRDIVTAERSLDLRDTLDRGRILLCKLAQGTVGVENAALLGSLLVSKIHQVVLARQETAASSRRPFYLYLDEFHEVATRSMATMFAGARKFGLGIIAAHQDLYQLHAKVPEVERAVLANAHTRIVFRVGDEDARQLERGCSFFEARDLASLAVGEAIARVGASTGDFNLRTFPLPEIDRDEAERRRAELRQLSAERYGSPRPQTERPREPTTGPAPPETEAPPVEPAPQPRPPVQPEVVEPPRAAASPAQTPGRGGAEHKYLQELIKAASEEHQFRATIEHHLPDGGRVDVLLERGETRIACEIAVESTVEREVENARKCLAAGFSCVALVSLKRGFLRKLSASLDDELAPGERSRVYLFAPEELLAFLAGQPWAEQENTVAGYRVKATYRASGEEDERRRRVRELLIGRRK